MKEPSSTTKALVVKFFFQLQHTFNFHSLQNKIDRSERGKRRNYDVQHMHVPPDEVIHELS
jgi:hypothetical protein